MSQGLPRSFTDGVLMGACLTEATQRKSGPLRLEPRLLRKHLDLILTFPTLGSWFAWEASVAFEKYPEQFWLASRLE